MIVFEGVSVAHAGAGYAAQPALREASFTIREGELVLVVGPTGSGKTSLLRCLGDPDRVGVEVSGLVAVDDVDVRPLEHRKWRSLVGYVRQNPSAGLGGETVEDHISTDLRSGPGDPHSGQRRVEEALDSVGLADLRGRQVTDLSGGQQQRVAIAAALVGHPRVLVLDEPTSALDPVAAEEVLAILHRLAHDVGITVLVAEHRLERVIHHADAVLLLDGGRVTGPLEPRAAMAGSALHPPVVALGRALGWAPLPLSVREARRQARQLRAQLTAATPEPLPSPGPVMPAKPATPVAATMPVTAAMPAVGVRVRGLSVVHGGTVAVRSVDLDVGAAEVVALMGRNGSGKSTLLRAVVGDLAPTSGRVRFEGGERYEVGGSPTLVGARVGLAPQDPSSLLREEPIGGQLSANDREHHLAAGSSSEMVDEMAPGLSRERLTSQLSEGQKMCLALALVLARSPGVVLLDEPTRGLDYAAKARLATMLRSLSLAGRAIVVATHDVELAAEVATRVVVLAEGEVVADGPSARILSDSPAFAPQVAKIVYPAPYLTVEAALAAAGRVDRP